MDLLRRLPLGDIASLAILVAAGVLLLVGARELPGPEFDPLGPAGMPKYIAYALLVLSAVLLGQTVSTLRHRARTGGEPRETRLSRSTELALSAAWVLGYLIVLTVGGLPFSVVTFVFLMLTGFTMTHFAVRKLPIVLAISIAVSFGLTFVFRDVLHVILPG